MKTTTLLNRMVLWPFSRRFKNLFILMLTLFSLVSGATIARAAEPGGQYVANNFLNTAILGIYSGGSYFENPSGEYANQVNTLNEGTGYPFYFEVSQPQVSGSPVQVGNTFNYTAPDGSIKCFNWYQQNYTFGVLAYSALMASDVMATSMKYETQTWFQYYYAYWKNYGITGDPGWQNYPCVSSNSITYGGEVFNQDPQVECNSYKTDLSAKIGLVIGNDITFPNSVTATGGTLTLNGTAYYIESPINDASQFSTGFVSQNFIQPQFPASQFDLSAQSQVETSDQGSPPGQMSISGLDGAAATAVASAQPGLIQVTDPVANTPGYEQSVPNYNSAYAMTSLNGTGTIYGQFQPDPNMVQQANTACSIQVIANMQPTFEYQEFHFAYNTFKIYDFKGLTWTLAEVNVLKNEIETTQDSQYQYVQTKNVENVYAITTITVPVDYASIYNWVPNQQNEGQQVTPPTQQVINYTVPSQVSGTTNVTVSNENTPSPFADLFNFWNADAGYIVAIIGLVVVAMITLYVWGAHQSSPANVMKKFYQMQQMGSMGQPLGMGGWQMQRMPANNVMPLASPQFLANASQPIQAEQTVQSGAQQQGQPMFNPYTGERLTQPFVGYSITANAPRHWGLFTGLVGALAVIVVIFVCIFKPVF